MLEIHLTTTNVVPVTLNVVMPKQAITMALTHVVASLWVSMLTTSRRHGIVMYMNSFPGNTP